MAFLNQITVNEECRKNDYGSSLLGKFEEISTERGCKLAACKVGWPEGLLTRDGNILFYKKCDWKLYDPSITDPVMAFKVLDANAPNKGLKRQTTANMIVSWKDEKLHDPFAPTPVG